MPGLLPFGCDLLQFGRLAVVFDLDETLVQSHTDLSLKKAIDRLERAR
jgi:hypothetical protein